VHAAPAKGDGVLGLGQVATGPLRREGEGEDGARGCSGSRCKGCGRGSRRGRDRVGGKSREGHGSGHAQGQGYTQGHTQGQGEGGHGYPSKLPSGLREPEGEDRFRTRRHYSKAGVANLKKGGRRPLRAVEQGQGRGQGQGQGQHRGAFLRGCKRPRSTRLCKGAPKGPQGGRAERNRGRAWGWDGDWHRDRGRSRRGGSTGEQCSGVQFWCSHRLG